MPRRGSACRALVSISVGAALAAAALVAAPGPVAGQPAATGAPAAPAPESGDATLPGPGAEPTMQAGDRWFPRDEQGRAFVMHGYNIKLHGDRLHEITPTVLATMRADGFTVLRLATFWADLEPSEGAFDQTYLDALRRVLHDADAVGLRVVLTMHQDSYSPDVGGYGMPDWTTRTDGLVYDDDVLLPCLDPANQRAWEHFWEDDDLQQFHVRAWVRMVEELGDEPALYGYDLLNEPCGQQRDGESTVQSLQRVEATQITPMLQRVTDAIRALDTERWIFLEGAFGLTSSLGSPGALGAVDDPAGRLIHAPHLYDLAMEVGSDWNPASPFVANYYGYIGDHGAEHEMPTVLFEWGPQKPALPHAADYVDQVLTGADAHLAGWSAFAWARGLAGWSQLDPAGHPGAAMTDTVQTYPMQVAGRPMSIVGDHAGGRSDVEVDPVGADASGATTFSFPLRRFPTGPDVSVASLGPARAPLSPDDWSWSFDAEAGTVTVAVDAAVAHRITVRPAVVSATATASDPEDTDGDGLIGPGDVVELRVEVTNLTDRELGAPAVGDATTTLACPTGPLAPGTTVTCTGPHVLTEAEAAAGAVDLTLTVSVADGEEIRTVVASATAGWTPSTPTTTTTTGPTTTAPAPTTTSDSAAGPETTTGPGSDGATGARRGALARTGGDPGPLVTVGVGALVLGAAAATLARRRRAT